MLRVNNLVWTDKDEFGNTICKSCEERIVNKPKNCNEMRHISYYLKMLRKNREYYNNIYYPKVKQIALPNMQ